MDEDENTLDDISGDEVSHLSISVPIHGGERGTSGDVGMLRRMILALERSAQWKLKNGCLQDTALPCNSAS